MMKERRVSLSAPLRLLELTDADLSAESRAGLLWVLQQMQIIRAFEEKLLALNDGGLINGPVHVSVSQEAVAVGAALALRREDKFCGTHRAHHQYLAKALSACTPKRYDPLRDGLTDAMQTHVLTLLKEIMGLAEGCSGGRGGSMHLYNAEIGVAGTNAIVGGGVPTASGVAWADRVQGRDAVTLCFYGDGAVYQGAVHEACNLASLWKAPIVYVIENNHYAVATSQTEGCSAPKLCQVAAAYGMAGFQADGMDPVAVKHAVARVTRDRTALPCVLELDTYRHYDHAGCIAGSAFGYRTKDEEAAWRERDPLTRFAQRLRSRRVTTAQVERLQEQAVACVEAAAAACLEVNASGATVIWDALWPAADTLQNGLRDERVAETGPFVEQAAVECTREIKYSDAIAEVTGRWLEQDPGVVVMGEEVANMGGGAYGATKGLAEVFPGRVRNSPITEAGFSGPGLRRGHERHASGCGADVVQFRPSGGRPALQPDRAARPHLRRARLRAAGGVYARGGRDWATGPSTAWTRVALFSLFPGWRIFVPTTPFDYIGLFNAAMKLKSPMLMVEHHGFYGQKGMIPDGPPDHVVQIGKAAVRREGKDVTVLSYGWGAHLALEAARQLAGEGIDVEVIDLRTVDDAGLDYDTIGRSLRKTGVLVTVEEAPACNAIGPKLVRACEQRWFDYLDGPAVSVNAPDVPLPVSRRLELLCLPTVERVAMAIRRTRVLESS